MRLESCPLRAVEADACLKTSADLSSSVAHISGYNPSQQSISLVYQPPRPSSADSAAVRWRRKDGLLHGIDGRVRCQYLLRRWPPPTR
jgi:hypothetical protein